MTAPEGTSGVRGGSAGSEGAQAVVGRRARDPKEPVSVRLPADLVAALRQKASDDDCTLSDVLRRGALELLGVCPTCERPVPDGDTPP